MSAYNEGPPNRGPLNIHMTMPIEEGTRLLAFGPRKLCMYVCMYIYIYRERER